MAGDLAAFSADLVAGDPPAIEWEQDAPPTARWDRLADGTDGIGWASSIVEAAELQAALGGVLLRPAWDSEVSDRPLLTLVGADEILPTFRFGQLSSVTVWSEVRREGDQVWRHLEHHEPGQIRHELWRGLAASIGRPVPLADHPSTSGLDPEIDTRALTGGRPGILPAWAPNVLPQPLVRSAPWGRPDIQGVETLLDGLDESYASLLRDIDLSRSRIMVPEGWLDQLDGDTGGSGERGFFDRWLGRGSAKRGFDRDAKVYVQMPGAPPDAAIQHIQPAMRIADHERALLLMVEQIAARCGYSPQSMGIRVEGQQSGTSLTIRERRSYRTRDRKRAYLAPALARCARSLLAIDRTVFGGPAMPTDLPTVQWSDADLTEPETVARTVALIRSAGAMSMEIAVRTLHPDWTDPQISEEVARIRAEEQLAPDPSALPVVPGEPTP